MKGLPLSSSHSSLKLSRRKGGKRTLIYHSFPFIFIWYYLVIISTYFKYYVLVFLHLSDIRSQAWSTFCAHNVNWCGRTAQSRPHSYGNFLHDTDTFQGSSKSSNSNNYAMKINFRHIIYFENREQNHWINLKL